jgi:hypothetical protein
VNATELCTQAASDLRHTVAAMRGAMQKNADPVFGLVILRLIARAATLERETSVVVGALLAQDVQVKPK